MRWRTGPMRRTNARRAMPAAASGRPRSSGRRHGGRTIRVPIAEVIPAGLRPRLQLYRTGGAVGECVTNPRRDKTPGQRNAVGGRRWWHGMKLYDGGMEPEPRRVRIFLAEKGVSVPSEAADLDALAHEHAALAVGELRRVPILELDDGTVITESMAICRYFEG